MYSIVSHQTLGTLISVSGNIESLSERNSLDNSIIILNCPVHCSIVVIVGSLQKATGFG